MASSSNRSSSSPILSRTNPASVVRNSETSDPVRKSFAENPFVKPSISANSRGLNPKTPANSPLADYHRRSSTGSRDFDEKENVKDHNLKPSRLRSPTLPNGAKNFMSPTISASSKIAMSPKKKILVEKNEPIRTSLSISDLKNSSVNLVNPHESAIQQTSFDQKPTYASSDLTDLRPAFQASSSIPKPSKTVTFSDCVTKHSSNAAFDNADPVNLADRCKISPASSYPSPKLCQTLAPLDADPSMPPYDSKTNYLSPRPQFLLYRPNPRIERYLHEEEDGTRLEEIFLSESFSDTEVTDETQSESFKNSDEVSSDEFVEKVKQDMDEEEEEKKSLSEPSDLIGKDAGVEYSEEKGNCKPFNLYKLTALILLLCFGCSSVLYTTPHVRNNYPSEIYQFAKLSYPQLVENFWMLYKNVVAYAHGLIVNFGEEHGLVHPVQYFNLTALREDISVDVNFVFDRNGRIEGFLSEPTTEITVESWSLEEEDELVQENFDLEEQENSEIMEDPEPSFEEQEHPESELRERHEELSAEKGDAESSKPVGVEEADEVDVKLNDDASKSFDTSAMAAFSNVNPPKMIAVILLLPLMAAAVYLHPRRVEAMSSNAKDLNTPKDVNLVDMVEESCSSHLSSFQKKSSDGNKGTRGAGSNKAQSQEIKLRKNGRRESVSSTSTDSPSYGSFTVYQKLSTKHSNCEDEVVTPVRRSSRINQVKCR